MAVYYIDNARGSDSNDGLTKDTAWKTLGHLRRGYNGVRNDFLLEMDSVWDLRSTNVNDLAVTFYNNRNESGLNPSNTYSEDQNTRIASYSYVSGPRRNRKPTILKNYKLLSNRDIPYLWKYDSSWKAWYIAFANYTANVESTAGGIVQFTLGANDAPHTGCPASLTSTGALPDGLQSVTVTGYSWSGGVCTFNLSGAHTLNVGDRFSLGQVSPQGANGTFVRLSGGTASQVRVAMPVNPGAYVSGGAFNYYVRPYSANTVGLFNSYDDAMSNSNRIALANGYGTHSITMRPSTAISTRNFNDLMKFNGEWGESYSQMGMVAPLPQQDGAYSMGYGTKGMYVYAPPDKDPGEYYLDVRLLASQVFQFWSPDGVTVDGLRFVDSSQGLVMQGDNGSRLPWIVKNCEAIGGAPLTSLVYSSTLGRKLNYKFISNFGYNLGSFLHQGYCPQEDSGGGISIAHNILDGCGQSQTVGGGIYLQINAFPHGNVMVRRNKIYRACHARGNANYDGSALYAEFGSNNIQWVENYVHGSPVAFLDNSGSIQTWLGNVTDGCGVSMIYSDAAGGSLTAVNARQLSMHNNSFVNQVDIRKFGTDLLGSKSVYKNIGRRFAVYSWNFGWRGTFTFSGDLITSNAVHGVGSPGTAKEVTFTSTGTLPSPLVTGRTYYARKVSNTTWRVYEDLNSMRASANALVLSGGTGTHTATSRLIVSIKNNLFHTKEPLGSAIECFYEPLVAPVDIDSNCFEGFARPATRENGSTAVPTVRSIIGSAGVDKNGYPMAGSALIAAGVPVGMPFQGRAPDIGSPLLKKRTIPQQRV